MSKTPAPNTRDLIRSTAPKLIELTEDVIYGDVWEREELSKRDRSLITLAALIAMDPHALDQALCNSNFRLHLSR